MRFMHIGAARLHGEARNLRQAYVAMLHRRMAYYVRRQTDILADVGPAGFGTISYAACDVMLAILRLLRAVAR